MNKLKLIASTLTLSLTLCLSAAAGPLDDAIQLYKEHKFAQAVHFFEAHYNETLADENAAYYYALALAESSQTERARHIAEYIAQRYPSTAAAQQAKVAMTLWKPTEPPKTSTVIKTTAPKGVVGIKYERIEGNNYLEISKVFPDGPAYGQLKVGDLITAVDQVPTCGCSMDEMYRRIVGEPNTVVKITVDRSGEALTVPLLRMSPDKFKNIEVRQGYQNESSQFQPTPSPSNSAKHPQFQVPYMMDGSKCMVDVLFNGQKLKMCVDSKSARTIIPLKYIDKSNKARPTGTPQSRNKSTGADVWRTTSTLQVGPFIREALPIEIVDHGSGQGTPILGNDFFDGYRRTQNTVAKTINAVRQDVAIPKNLIKAASDAESDAPMYPSQFRIDYQLQEAKQMVWVSYHGKALQMCIDNESAKTSIPVKYIDKLNLPRPSGPSATYYAGIGEGTWRTTETLQLGPLIREDFPVDILDESVPGIPTLGRDFFDGYKSTVNSSGRMIDFVRQTPIPKRQKRKLTFQLPKRNSG